MTNTQRYNPGIWMGSRMGLGFLALLAIAVLFLVTEHTTHFFGILPYLLLVLSVPLHLFMHRGHGEHGGHSESTGHAGHIEGSHQNPERDPQ